jgi:uncharacterized protein (TIGR02246 family)
MNSATRRLLHVSALMILTAFLMVGTPAQSNSGAETKARNGIGKTIAGLENAWNAHDAQAFASYFADDADFTNVFGQSAHGRQEIEKFHAPIFASIFKNSTLRSDDTKNKIRFLKSDIAAVDIFWSMTGVTDPNGKLAPERKGLLNAIMMPVNGKWLIKVMHNMDLVEPRR